MADASTDLGPCDADNCDAHDFVTGWMLDTRRRDADLDVPVVKIFCSRGCADDYRENHDG